MRQSRTRCPQADESLRRQLSHRWRDRETKPLFRFSLPAVAFGGGGLRVFLSALDAGGYRGGVAYAMCSPLRSGGSLENLDHYARRFLGFLRGLRWNAAAQKM